MSDDGPTPADRTTSGDDDRRSADGGAPGPSAQSERQSPRGPPANRRDNSSAQSGETTWRAFARDIFTSALAVGFVGAYLFAVSGVWPPLVAIESPSMTPNMEVNDLVFVMDEQRFPGEGAAGDTGVVTATAGDRVGYATFGRHGDVVVYRPNGDRGQTPIIHRAMLYVEEGENWYDRANPAYLGGADSCADLRYCRPEQAGFITKGDANTNYDQVEPSVISQPVRPEWIVGTAEARVPGLGWLRLRT